jgi:hypothetical protein
MPYVKLDLCYKEELTTVEFQYNYTHNKLLEFHTKDNKANIRISLNKCTGYIFLESEDKNHFLYLTDYETKKKKSRQINFPVRYAYCGPDHLPGKQSNSKNVDR